jgi:hypothetical protein
MALRGYIIADYSFDSSDIDTDDDYSDTEDT